jgi:hypothetical protein
MREGKGLSMRLIKHVGVCNLNFGNTRLYSGQLEAPAALPARREPSGEEENPFSPGNRSRIIKRYLLGKAVSNPQVSYGALLETKLHYCASKHLCTRVTISH